MKKASGFPEGSILSVRAGQLRRQGPLSCQKPIQFGTSLLDANPFKVDVYAPLASKRVTLVPQVDQYSLTFDAPGMELDIVVKEVATTRVGGGKFAVDPKQDRVALEAKQMKKQKTAVETQEYIDRHNLVQFVQNLMQSVLAEKPADPFAYIEATMRAARSNDQSPTKQRVSFHLEDQKPPQLQNTPSVTPSRLRVKPVPHGPVFAPTPGKGFSGPAYVVQDPDGQVLSHAPLRKEDLMSTNSELRRLRVPHLKDKFSGESFDSPLKHVTSTFYTDKDYVLQSIHKNGGGATYYQMRCAGPRAELHFNPKRTAAAIVTCGGLCPGLNSVIREVVMMLYTYGVDRVYGVVGGYKGVMTPENWLDLTPDVVQDIHIQGGTLLVSDRGNPPHSEMARVLRDQGIKQYFVIGGDGTLTGAMQTYDAMCEIGWECSVIGVPKTIDNDIAVIDKTFGFDTACTEAKKAIDSAYVEATCNANCLGLVKLMGRHAGFIAMNACLAARNVDVCLLPEMEISLEKLLAHILELMQSKGHAVVVVAEGCGDTLIKSSDEKDAGGNLKLADVGPWLKDRIADRFKEVRLPLAIKYIDPTYMIRAVPPNCYDRVYCSKMAWDAVHAAMAGFTCVTIGRVQNHYSILPTEVLVKNIPKRVDINGRWFQRLIASTTQPPMAPDIIGSTTAAPEKKQEDAAVMLRNSDPVQLAQVSRSDDEIRCQLLQHLGDRFGAKEIPSTLEGTSVGKATSGWVDGEAWTTQTTSNKDHNAVRLQFLRVGPRQNLQFQPDEVVAAIVTCGSFSPGVNSVIRELVMMLSQYGVRKVYGIKGGFNGVIAPTTWVTLRPESVTGLHTFGGSVLVSDCGHPGIADMAEALQSRRVSQFFCVGGHGTHKGALAIDQAFKEQKFECSVVCIPQNVENDFHLLDRTFGYDTACTEAEKAVDIAYVEATGFSNCIALVKLMGRTAGSIAMQACLAARHVDVCLLPEMEIDLEKLLDHVVELVQRHGYAVIVVSEGCCETLPPTPVSDIGLFLKDSFEKHFSRNKLPCNVRYFDPTYMIRAVPPNANDSTKCSILAHAAVHGAMAGYTSITCAQVDGNFVYLPVRVLVQAGQCRIDIKGPPGERLLAATHQPNLGYEGTAVATAINPTRLARMAKQRRTSFLGAEVDQVRVPHTKLNILNGFGEVVTRRPLRRDDILQEADAVRKLPCFHLSQRFGQQRIPSTLIRKEGKKAFMDETSFSTQSMQTGADGAHKATAYYQMVRAGPREFLHFDPCDPAATALIVSCGGICPGLNSVIREVVNTLWQYGVRKIYGVRGGYKGVMEPDNWLRLSPETVHDIHMKGGTMLISDRGNPEHKDMAQVLKAHNVKQYFILGGDGTHKGAMQTFDCLQEVNHECAVIGVPKTIDNDVPMMDQTFGFDTACMEALKAVESAYVESISSSNCIGLVKLMGRHCGHIAMNASIAASFVDICLLPEMTIDLDQVLQHTMSLMNTKGHAVIVVAEGCGDTIVTSGDEQDAGGNKKLADVGMYLKDVIAKYFKEHQHPLTIKFNDPTYMIRSVPADAYDSVYCAILAQNAVHGAMAGFSGITVGKVCSRYVYLPIHAITKQPGNRVDVTGKRFANLISSTGQPDFTPQVPDKASSSLCSSASSEDQYVLNVLSQVASVNSLLRVGDEVSRLDVLKLGSLFRSAMVPNPIRTTRFSSGDSWSMQTAQQNNRRQEGGHTYYQLIAAGPREHLHFDPATSSACIVNCGGLCPGLNAVIRELVMMLTAYGVQNIYGCKGGYKGLVTPEHWIKLAPNAVEKIHQLGGTVLVSDRGNPPHAMIAKSLRSMNIKQYFVLGGDGTHKGGMQTFEAMQALEEGPYECAVVGVPKTIDNDILMLDRTFGFNSAVTEAEKAIDAARAEAMSADNCIGLVKLMGRHCGFIAMEATLAARHVDVVLLPEMAVSLPKLLNFCFQRIKTKNRMVIVIAEGCGDTLIKSGKGVDAGGNKVLADVGPWLKEQLEGHFGKMGLPVDIRYIDPTYMIRAVPSNANDTVLCTVLAQNAVHAAMAGYSGVTVGKVDEQSVILPIHAVTGGTRKVNTKGRQFERLMRTTEQPDLTPGPGDDWALLPPPPAAEDVPVTKEDPPPTDSEVQEILATLDAPRSKLVPGDVDEVNVVDATLKVMDGHGNILSSSPLKRQDICQAHDDFYFLDVLHLSCRFPSAAVPSPLKGQTSNFQDNESWSTQSFSLNDTVDSLTGVPYYQMVRAGPRESLHFNPKDQAACAAIVTCGCLCPGLNSAIRELFMMLKVYGVPIVFGIKMGFNGIPKDSQWMELTEEMVKEIHMDGGSFLGAAPGNDSAQSSAANLMKRNVRQLFVIGGDGSQKGASHILSLMVKADYQCAVVNVPKTIDNDLPIMDKTFGFDTAVCEARRAIDAAYVEATCNANCIGLVKLLGKESGFIPMYASISSRVVDLCIVPEMMVDMQKVVNYCEELMVSKGYAVIVITDGCAESFRLSGASLGAGEELGSWFRDQILDRFKEKGTPLTIKYIDPTYMIRAVAANAQDNVYCKVLAGHAVHGAMAGFTGITVAKVNERFVYLPTYAMSRQALKRIDPKGRWITRMALNTGQPDLSKDNLPVEAPRRKDKDDDYIRTCARKVSINAALQDGFELHRYEVKYLATKENPPIVDNPIVNRSGTAFNRQLCMHDASWCTQTFQKWHHDDEKSYRPMQMLRSGPREKIYWDPNDPKNCAAIVTCGGICPGLNSVIRELVKMLGAYGVNKIYGIIGGFKGCIAPETWIELTDEGVQNIHNEGGSVLVNDRGNPPHIEIARSLASQHVRQYFVLGGDGTLKGAMQTFDAMQELAYECSVVGIPKTIDNDVPLLDTSFGFDTASTEAEKAIRSAYVESTTNANCIGLVKLMGRHCGFIAAQSTLAAQVVDICLIPEMPIQKHKLLDYVAHLLRRKGQAVIVVAEGCGDTILSSDNGERDAGGNMIMQDVGPYLKKLMSDHCAKLGLPLSIKYIDPTYMIRSVQANAYDSLYCSTLAQQAVHSAIAGYTGFCVGKVDERYVMLPIHAITDRGTRNVDINGRIYERLLAATKQPSFA